MKKILWFIPFIILTCLLSTSVFAEEIYYEPSTAYQDGYYGDEYPSISAFALVDIPTDELKSRIENAWKNLDDEIDISDFNLRTIDEVKQYIIPVYKAMLNENPEYFYVAGGFSYSTQVLNPSYRFSKSDIPLLTQKFNAAVDKALECVDTSTMDDIDIALALHDYLVLNADYDYDTLINSNDNHPTSFSAYGVLVEKTGVCQSYMLAYNLLLERCGIEVGIVNGPDINHIWNLVKIDGEYYQVDVTWDDPTSPGIGNSRDGVSSYKYFLGSDELFATDGYHGNTWYGTYPAESYKYDNAFWRNSDSTMAFFEGEYYFGQNFRLYSAASLDLAIDNCSVIAEIDDKNCKADGGQLYSISALRIIPFVCDGRLYYNSARNIYRYCPTLSDDELVYTIDSEYGFIVPLPHIIYENAWFRHCTFKVEGQSLVLTHSEPIEIKVTTLGHTPSSSVSHVPTDTTAGYTEYTCPCGAHYIDGVTAPLKYLLGDVNSDGTVGVDDYTYIARYLAHWNNYDTIKYTFNADINDDGNVDAIDFIYFGRHLANWMGYTELPSKY